MTRPQIDNEKLLFLYSCALEDADFKAVQDILSQAEHDVELMMQLREIESVYQAELQSPRTDTTRVPITSEYPKSGVNGHGAEQVLPIRPYSFNQPTKRGKSLMRIAILIMTILGGFFTYIGTHQDDSPVLVTEIPSGQSATLLPQADRVPITTDNVDQLAVLSTYGEIEQDSGVAWSHDGQQFYIYGSMGITIYDSHTYTAIETLNVKSHVRNLAVNPQAPEVAFVNEDSQLVILNLETQETHLLTETDHEWSFGLTYSPDGATIALIYGNEEVVHVLDSQTGEKQMILHSHSSEIRQLVFSPDGRYLVGLGTIGIVGGVRYTDPEFSDQGAIIWDIEIGLPVTTLRAPLDTINSLIFSNDGQYIMIIDAGGPIYIWDTSELNYDTYRSYSTLNAFIQKGQLIPDSEAGFWKFRTGGWLTSENTLLTFHNERFPGFETWDIENQVRQESFTISGLSSDDREVFANYIPSPNGQQVLRIVSKKIQIIDLASQSLVAEIPYHQEFWNNIIFDAETSHLAMRSQNAIVVWDVMSGEEIKRFYNSQDYFPGITAIQFLPTDSNKLMIAGQLNNQKGIISWDLADDDINRIGESNYDGVVSIDIDAQNHIVFAGENGYLRWLGIDENLALTDQKQISNDLYVRADYVGTNIETIWTKDGNIVVKDYRKQITVINGETGETIAELSGHIDTIADMTLSLDGSLLASVDYAGTLILWDTTTWEQLTKIYNVGEFAHAGSVSIASDNRLIAISGDGKVILWDSETQSTVATLENTDTVEFSPDGTLLATIKDNGVALWGIAQ